MKRMLLILAMVAVMTSPALADRSLSGSYVQMMSPDPAIFLPNTNYTVDFYVYNGSTDAEWILEVWFLFPECFDVLGGSYTPDPDAQGSWDFAFAIFGPSDNGALFYDNNGGYGEIWGGEGGHFYVDVFVGDCECGPAAVQWYLEGDQWGGDPHWLEGYIDIQICDETATLSTDWSALKALY